MNLQLVCFSLPALLKQQGVNIRVLTGDLAISYAIKPNLGQRAMQLSLKMTMEVDSYDLVRQLLMQINEICVSPECK